MNSRSLGIELRSTWCEIHQINEDYYLCWLPADCVDIFVRKPNGSFKEVPGEYSARKILSIIVLENEETIQGHFKTSINEMAVIKIHRDGTQSVVIGNVDFAKIIIYYLEGYHGFDSYYLIDCKKTFENTPLIMKIDLKRYSLDVARETNLRKYSVIKHETLGLVFFDGKRAEGSLNVVHRGRCLKYGFEYYISAIPLSYYLGVSGCCQINIFRASGEIFRSILFKRNRLSSIDYMVLYGRFIYICETDYSYGLGSCHQVHCLDIANAIPKKNMYLWEQDVIPIADPPSFCEDIIEKEKKKGYDADDVQSVSPRNSILFQNMDGCWLLDYYDFRRGFLEELPDVVKREAMALLLCWRFGSVGLEIIPREVMDHIMYFLI